jgi:hypothetical protein
MVLIVLLALSTTNSLAFRFPDTLDLKEGRIVSERSRGLPVLFLPDGDKNALTIMVQWGKKGIQQIEYQRNKMFSDALFSDIAGTFARGATWHEIPNVGSEKRALREQFPGIEQQWLLKGYGDVSGWMGSGVREDKYFLVFRAQAPRSMRPVSEPLDFKTDIREYFLSSSGWVSSKCSNPGTGGMCYNSLNDPLFQAETDSGGNGSLHIWYREDKPIEDIRDAIASLPPSARREYAGELSALARFESQSVLIRLAQKAPDLFNWPSWQIQDMVQGRLSARDFEKEFFKRGGDWPSIPILRFKGQKLDIDIYLHFTGHYSIHVREK